MARIDLERFYLRRFTAADLEKMIELESDPDVMKFTPSRIPIPINVSKKRLEDLIDKEATYGNLGIWAAEFKKTGEFLGWFMLLKREHELVELGFMIVKRYWGEGFTTEVARGLIEYGIGSLKLSGLSAKTTENNLASQKVLQKLGFIFEKKESFFDPVLKHEISVLHYALRP